MSQINLLQGESSATRPPRVGLAGSSLFLSFALIALSFGVYYGVKFYGASLQKELDSIKAEEEERKALIYGEKADRVFDFSNRLTIIDANLTSFPESPNTPLSKIESAMIPEVNLISFEFSVEGKLVEIKLLADSFKSIAQQMVTLKKEFSSVTITKDAFLNQEGKIESDLSLTL